MEGTTFTYLAERAAEHKTIIRKNQMSKVIARSAGQHPLPVITANGCYPACRVYAVQAGARSL